MSSLKNLFPFSYKKTLGGFIVSLIVYVLIAIVASLAIGFAGLIGGWIPVVGALLGIVLRIIGIIVDVYIVAGIIILILVFLNIIKD